MHSHKRGGKKKAGMNENVCVFVAKSSSFSLDFNLHMSGRRLILRRRFCARRGLK